MVIDSRQRAMGKVMQRRGFLAAIGAGTAAGLLARPSGAFALTDDVSRPPHHFPSLYGTREQFVGSTVQKLPRARTVTQPLDNDSAMHFARSLYKHVPAATAGGSHWSNILDSAASLNPMDRLRMVNDFANRMPYVEDLENYGLKDFWAEPRTFFRNGGDCEDFALAKYKLLHRIGFHPDRLRIVLVVDKVRRVQHAVLAANVNGEAWMLDSLVRDVVPHEVASQYRPTVSLSGPRLYLHIAPKA